MIEHRSDRREFLQAGVAGLATCGLLTQSCMAADPKPQLPPRIDCHLHCFAGKDDERFPYHPKGPYQPEVAATPEHLLECMDAAGVANAIVVHPEPYGDDHRYLEYCLQVGKGRLKGTILVFSDDPKSLAQLPTLAKKLPIVAARVHAYAPERLPPFGKPELKQLWKLATDNGLAMQLHFEPRYAPGFEPLIRAFPDTLVIIDHLGRPLQGTPEEHAVVVGWAKYKNTVMKISSLPTDRAYPHRQIQPIVNQLAEAYGADRMIYGGGFSGPETTGESYRAAFDYAAKLLSEKLSADEQAKVLGGNAQRLFGFKT
jgi:predicted TIM-barrel fold metal-dependent hydrolase